MVPKHEPLMTPKKLTSYDAARGIYEMGIIRDKRTIPFTSYNFSKRAFMHHTAIVNKEWCNMRSGCAEDVMYNTGFDVRQLATWS